MAFFDIYDEDEDEDELPDFEEAVGGDEDELDVDQDELIGDTQVDSLVCSDSEPVETLIKMGVNGHDPFLELRGYDTESDLETGLCCGECGEPLEAVVTDVEHETPFGGSWPTTQLEGFVCGCRETPGWFTIETLGD